MNKQDDNLFMMCDCQDHALFVEAHPSDRSLWISLFERGVEGKKLSILQRLRWCWYILKNGHPYTDMIIFDEFKAKELKKFLSKHF